MLKDVQVGIVIEFSFWFTCQFFIWSSIYQVKKTTKNTKRKIRIEINIKCVIKTLLVKQQEA